MSLNYPIYIYPFYMDKAKRVMTEIVDQANQMYLCFFQVLNSLVISDLDVSYS